MNEQGWQGAVSARLRLGKLASKQVLARDKVGALAREAKGKIFWRRHLRARARRDGSLECVGPIWSIAGPRALRQIWQASAQDGCRLGCMSSCSSERAQYANRTVTSTLVSTGTWTPGGSIQALSYSSPSSRSESCNQPPARCNGKRACRRPNTMIQFRLSPSPTSRLFLCLSPSSSISRRPLLASLLSLLSSLACRRFGRAPPPSGRFDSLAGRLCAPVRSASATLAQGNKRQ